MTSQIAWIGQRMREVREKTGYSQSKLAAMLDLSDRAYKNYELGKRDPPIDIVARLAAKFEVDLEWLILGGERQPRDIKMIALAGNVSDATYSVATENGQPTFGAKKYSKFYRYVLEQCLSKGSDPIDEARTVYELMRESDE